VGAGHARDNEAMKNILRNIPENLPEELLESLAEDSNTSIKRIVSKGHTTDWYDQDQHEFVVVLKGAAKLEFEGSRYQEMGPGDWLHIPAHVRHRVAWTSESEETVWLAVHYTGADVAE